MTIAKKFIKFDTLFPNADVYDQITVSGDEILKSSEWYHCVKCYSSTHWLTVSFECPICSEDCLEQLWAEYFDAI